MEDLAEGRYRLILTILLNCLTSMKHFMANYPAAVSELKQIAGCDSIMIDHIRNGPSADWIPLNSQCDAWDNDKFWKLMNEALSLASEPAPSVPDAKGSPRTPARARLGEGEKAASASRKENDHPPSQSSERSSAISAPQHSASDEAKARQIDSVPAAPEMDSRNHTVQDSAPVNQQQLQRYQTAPLQAGTDSASTIQQSLSQAAAEQSITPAQLLTPTPSTQQGANARCTPQSANPVGLSHSQYQCNPSTVGYPAIPGNDYATAFESNNRTGPNWNAAGPTTMPAMLNQRMATVPMPYMIPTAWQAPPVPAAQVQGAFVSPGQLTLGAQQPIGPALTGPAQNVHWPNGGFAEAGAEDYTTQPYSNSDGHQSLQ
jgi:hypothetical protein